MDKLEEAKNRAIKKILQKREEDSLNSLAQIAIEREQRKKHVAKLKDWESAINDRHLWLEKWLVPEQEKNIFEMQKYCIRQISSSIRNLINDNRELNEENYYELEKLFSNIQKLVVYCGITTTSEALKRASEMYHDLIEVNNLKQKISFEELQKQFNVLKKTFNQESDPKRELLFRNAVTRHSKFNRGKRNKRGYTWEMALENENNEGKDYYSQKEFDLSFDQITNHFKVWRTRNKKLVSELEKGYTV